MVTIQFGLLKTSGQVYYQPEDHIYVLDNTIIGSITIPTVNKSNIVEYLTSKFGILTDGAYDDDYFAAYAEMLSYPNSMMAVQLTEISDSDEESFVSRRGMVYMIDGTTIYVRLPFDVPRDNLHALSVEIGIDLSTETITKLRILVDAHVSGNLADLYTFTHAVITDTASAGSSNTGSGWTGKDGYVDNDKSLESAFISNAKPGNSGSTATYKPDEDGFFYLQ